MDASVSQVRSSVPEVTSQKSTVPERATAPKEAPKVAALQLKKKKQTKQNTQLVGKKLESLLKLINKDRKQNVMHSLESKKVKANKVRQRKQPQVIVAEITLNSSDEESKPVEHIKSTVHSVSDGETDEVIIIPTPPPPQICIDCSDEEENQSIQFALPKSQKKKKKGQMIVNSPRCRSPSNSSIMSDDFIGQLDRSRLNDNFAENVPSDDELECSMEGLSGKRLKDAPDRVPSISSEDTVCTSGDITDQEKHPYEMDKGLARSKSQPEGNAKSKKENAASKKTPSKQKPTKTVSIASNVGTVTLPSVSKRNANNKTNCGAISNDTLNNSKTPAKTKARCKSPVTPGMEIVRNKVETPQVREGSGKKVKAKKDGPSLKVTRSMLKSVLQASAGSGTISDKPTEGIKNSNAPKTGTKSKTKKILPIDDNVSSESDIDIFSKTTSNASTPQGKQNTSRPSASSLLEEIGDVSSESDYDESFLQLQKTVAPKPTAEKERPKRIGRKRKQYNSETYSDEDFACLLTDIVRAVSDTEDEDDYTEMDINETNASNVQKAAIPTSSSEEIGNRKKKRKRKDLSPETGSAVSEPPSKDTDKPQQSTTELAAKKKKKLKNPKSSVKTLSSRVSNTPEIDSADVCVTVDQTQDATRKERSVIVPPPPQHVQQNVLDSSDEDVQIIERHAVPSTSGESSKVIQPIGPDCAWNEEMKHFYNESWIDEDFNMDLVLRRMPYDSRNWSIVHKDRFPDPPKKSVTCNNCGEQGHVRYKCRNAPKLPICFMCGEKGHKEPRCPKTICLNARSFVRSCKSCARDADITCFTCGLRGHAQRSCPDLWRRYHSTIEDNVPLREHYETNTKARWCSICGRQGHQAHTCNDARRIFTHTIPSIRVSSYMPAYRGEYNRYSKHRNDEQERRLATDPAARYNLFSTDANSCEFNLPELTKNENGFYFNFLKSTGLLEKYKRPVSKASMETVMPPQPHTIVQPAVEAQPRMESTRPETPPDMLIDESTIQPEPQRTEQTTCAIETDEQQGMSMEASGVPVMEENSNYSFSEFHTEEKQLDDTEQYVDIKPPSLPSDSVVPKGNNNFEQLMHSDYISLNTTDAVATPPLSEQHVLPPPQSTQSPDSASGADLAIGNVPNAEVTSPEEDQVYNAKVLLTKDRATLLLSAKGAEFINEAGKKHSVQLSITFESVGNVLLITGTPDAQENFHADLVRYLTEQEDYMRNEKYFRVFGPKMSNKMTRYIAMFLRGLVEDNVGVASLLAKFESATSADTQERHRRRLNVLLFGVYGLREGRKHLNVLRYQLELCMKANPWKSELPPQRRTIIDEAIRYIFSAYDHKDYALLVKEYEELKQANKLQKLTYADLGIPWIITKPKTLHQELHKHRVQDIRKAKLKEKVTRQPETSRHVQEFTAEDKHYTNFLRRATTYRPEDATRYTQYENFTRTIHQTLGSENMAYGSHGSHNSWRHHDNVWHRDNRSPRSERYPQYGRSQVLDHGQPSSSNASRLAHRANALRDQEYNHLQRLQDLYGER
uniref:Zinc finger CCHC domain-containing protein 7 n=1 Tax=Anopheles culicifacies TaxID=139723 RepID=A0A182MR23_9DIPT